MKKINKIYEHYFDIIDSYFGSIKHYLKEDKYSHIDLGNAIGNYPMISDLLVDAIDGLNEEIIQFWSNNAASILNLIKKQDSLRCVYSGDISPVTLEDFVKKSLLYIDTVVIPDPILNLTLLQRQTTLDRKIYINKLVRHVFNVWKIKDLIFTDTEINPIIIFPINLQIMNKDDEKLLLQDASQEFTSYINNIFDKSFTDKNNSLEFLQQFETASKIFEQIKQFSLLPNAFKEFSTFEEFLTDFSDTRKHFQIGKKSLGWDFGEYLLSQFIRVQEHKFFCNKVSGEPIYDYDLPYFFFSYEMGGLDMDASIANALQKEKFNWIADVPLPALKIFREENKLDYMRSILRKGITDLKAKKDKDLLKISKELEKNFKEAFKKQEMEKASLQEEATAIVKKEIPIQIVANLVGFIPIIGDYASIPFAYESISNLLKQHREIKQKLEDKKSDFINLLIKSYKKGG